MDKIIKKKLGAVEAKLKKAEKDLVKKDKKADKKCPARKREER